MAITFVLNDENVNRYGFRVLTSGIDLTNFLKNPIALFMHMRAHHTLPIGKWVNVRTEGSKLLADIEFDESDEFALQIKSKVDQGILSACSISFDPLELSAENAIIGQTLETVVKCELREVSIVDIPGNQNSVKLDYHLANGKEIDSIPKLNLINQKPYKMKKILTLLCIAEALTAEATEEAVLDKVKDLQSELAAVKDENVTLKADKSSVEKEALIAPLLVSGQLKAEQKPSLLKMETEDLKSFIANMPKPTTTKTLAGQIGGGAEDKRAAWNLNDWMKNDDAGLLAMKNGTHELYSKADYARLFKEQYSKA